MPKRLLKTFSYPIEAHWYRLARLPQEPSAKREATEVRKGRRETWGQLRQAAQPPSLGLKLKDETIINVRNFSSSGVGRWTVQIIGDKNLRVVHGKPQTEIKFL